MPDPTTPRSAPVYLPDFRDVGDNSYLSAVRDNATYENTKAASLDADSPDSGHKEMSSDSLSYSVGHSDSNGWSHNLNTSPAKQATRNPFENSFNPTTTTTSSSSSSCCAASSAPVERKEGGGGGVGPGADKVQIITPLPLQDASGNRLDLKIGAPAPRLDPPPRVYRSTRNGDRSERGSWYGGGGGGGDGGVPTSSSSSVSDANANFHVPTAMSDSDYCSTYASSHSGGVPTVTYRSHSHMNGGVGGGGGSHGLNALMRYSDSSARSSLYSEGNRDSMASLSALRQKLDLKVNDLNHNDQGNNHNHHHHYQQQQQQHSSNGRWKMRISYTSDENSDNSDDMNVSAASPTKGNNSHKIQLSALDEFDTLRT